MPSDHCWIVFTVTSNSEVPAGEVSLRYELEPTGGPDAGPGLPGWVTPQETSISAPSDRTVDIARASLVEHLLDCLDSGTIPVTSADRARHVLEIMPPRTSARVARVAELTTTFAPYPPHSPLCAAARLTRARSKVGRADALSWMKAGTV